MKNYNTLFLYKESVYKKLGWGDKTLGRTFGRTFLYIENLIVITFEEYFVSVA